MAKKRGTRHPADDSNQPAPFLQPASVGVVFLRSHTHAGHEFSEGETAEVSDTLAERLLGLGVVEVARQPQPEALEESNEQHDQGQPDAE